MLEQQVADLQAQLRRRDAGAGRDAAMKVGGDATSLDGAGNPSAAQVDEQIRILDEKLHRVPEQLVKQVLELGAVRTKLPADRESVVAKRRDPRPVGAQFAEVSREIYHLGQKIQRADAAAQQPRDAIKKLEATAAEEEASLSHFRLQLVELEGQRLELARKLIPPPASGGEPAQTVAGSFSIETLGATLRRHDVQDELLDKIAQTEEAFQLVAAAGAGADAAADSGLAAGSTPDDVEDVPELEPLPSLQGASEGDLKQLFADIGTPSEDFLNLDCPKLRSASDMLHRRVSAYKPADSFTEQGEHLDGQAKTHDTGDAESLDEAKGAVTTVNVSGAGSLVDYLAQEPPGKVIAVQQHYARGDRLHPMRKQALDLDYHGVWAEALLTEDGGTSGGVCAVATTGMMVIEAPSCIGHAGLPALRFTAARIHWIVAKGLTIASVYVLDGQGLGPDSAFIIEGVVRHAGMLHAMGINWMVLGDWEFKPSEWGPARLRTVHGHLHQSEEPTCAKSIPGKVCDSAVATVNLQSRLSEPVVDHGVEYLGCVGAWETYSGMMSNYDRLGGSAEADKIWPAFMKSCGLDPEKVKADAEAVMQWAKGVSPAQILEAMARASAARPTGLWTPCLASRLASTASLSALASSR
ncbi:unnamed protein product [Prorocentrum cordatum]|uniref:Uncharacterized protein n=1 Tax=Prorocentrum cordatum TaxID=2364126 RepID=A0ABN9S040_9DINO|nr:unnamed protein product [Polarella glacialis]